MRSGERLAVGVLLLGPLLPGTGRAVAAPDPARLRETARWGDTRLCHAGTLTSITLLPDGRRVMTTARDNTTRIWEIATGRELHRLDNEKDDDVWSAAVLPDGGRVLVTDDDRVVLRDLATGGRLAEYVVEAKQAVFRLRLLPGGRRFVACGAKGGVRLWDVADAKVVREYAGFTESVYAVAATPDGRLLAAGGDAKVIRVWEIETGAPVRTFSHDDDVYSLVVTPDGRRLVSCGNDKTVRAWSLESGESLWKAAFEDDIEVVDVSPDGRRVAAGVKETLVLLDAGTGVVIRTIPTPGESHWPVAFSADGLALWSGAYGAVCRWDVETGRRLDPPPDVALPVIVPDCVEPAFPAGRIVAGDQKALFAWDVRNGRLLPSSPLPESIRALAVSADGRTAAVATSDNRVLQVDVGTLAPVAGRETRLESGADRMAMAGGRILVSWDESLRVLRDDWSGAPVPLGAKNHRIRGLAISSDGLLAATAGNDGRIRLWDLVGGAEAAALVVYDRAEDSAKEKASSRDPERVVFSPDHRSLLASTEDRKLRAWRSGAGTEGGAASSRDVREWLEGLGSDDFETRERATARMVAEGERVLTAIEAFDARGDAEITARLRAVRSRLALARLPTVPAGELELGRQIADVVFLPDGRTWAAVAGVGATGELVLGALDAEGLRVLRRLPAGAGPSRVFAAPDGATLYTVNRDGTVSVYGFAP
jgi:WD40 repeat protein